MRKLLIVSLLSCSLPAYAQVTSTQTFSNFINSLPSAGSIGLTDQLYLRQAGVSRQVTGSILLNLITSNSISNTLTSGNIIVGNSGNIATAFSMSGDCSISNTASILCTKTNGVAFAASATTNTTNANNITTGTLPAGQMPGLTGDVTSTAGTVATTIAANVVSNTKLAQAGANTVKGNFTGGTTNEADNSIPSCSATNSGLEYTSNSGFNCINDVARLTIADQTVSGGANVTALSLATGNITVDCGKVPLQFITNGAAFTITAPVNDGSCLVLVTNNGTAGAISFSGFSVGTNTGDTLDTTNTHKFTINIWRINGTSGYRVAAHQ